MDRDLCAKCQLTCSSLHSYAPEDCPLQICNVCRRLKELDARIANVEGLLANLSEERRNLKSTINRHHDPLIHRFPLELVSQIFISFVEVHNSISAVYTDVWNPLLLLGAVCRGWRDITLNIPELWANVTINVPQEASPLWLEIVDVWFRRSGSVPLLLAVKNSYRRPEVWNASRILASNDVFQLLRSHSPRWKSLSLDCPLSIAYALLDGLDVSHIDGLRLSLRTTVRGVGEPVLIPLQVPFALRSLYIAGYSLLDNVSVQWDRLTSLEAHTIDANELLYILQQAINLQTLQIGNTGTRPKRIPGDPYPEPDIPFALKSLTSLDVTVSLVKNNILRHLTLPALQNLRYSYIGPAADTDLDILGELLDRSAPHSLKSFTFLCSTSEDLTKIYTYPDEDSYDKIPGITHLIITVRTVPGLIRMGENLLRPLTTHREKVILPRFQHLDLTAPILSATSWSYLCNIIDPEDIQGSSVTDTAGSKQQSRMRPIPRVSVNLQVEWMPSQDRVLIDEAAYLRLRKIQDSGVQVNVVANRGDIDVLKAYEDIYETKRQQI